MHIAEEARIWAWTRSLLETRPFGLHPTPRGSIRRVS